VSPNSRAKWGKIDFVVHAIAFLRQGQLEGRLSRNTAENSPKTMLIQLLFADGNRAAAAKAFDRRRLDFGR